MVGAAAAALTLAACGPDEPADPVPDDVEDLDPEPDADDPDAAEPDDDTVADDEDAATDDEADGTEPLSGEPSTDTVDEEADFGLLAVTDVRVATHDGFDRIVAELAGDGTAGWHIGYVDQPRSQGSGQDVDVAGEAFLSVAIHGVALPPDLPDDIEPWDAGRLAGPADGIVVEVVDDSIFEGIHLLFAGVDAQRPFLVERFADPQRVVIDVFHEP